MGILKLGAIPFGSSKSTTRLGRSRSRMDKDKGVLIRQTTWYKR